MRGPESTTLFKKGRVLYGAIEKHGRDGNESELSGLVIHIEFLLGGSTAPYYSVYFHFQPLAVRAWYLRGGRSKNMR